MKRLVYICLTLCMAVSLMAVLGCSSEPDTAKNGPEIGQKDGQKKKMYLAFGGGPTGGTFNFFANKMSSIISAQYDRLEISPKGSGGSAENLRTLNKNTMDFGIVYSGDAFLGRNGKLPNDTIQYDSVRSLSFLYGAPAQLVVRADSGINSAYDLVGKTIAIGNPGSGAALAAERFFRHLGLWDKVEHRNLGYSQAAQDFTNRKIDAFWVLVGYPNSSIIEASTQGHIKLLDLHKDATQSGFYDLYPFYSMVEIPADTYEGQSEPVITFQDASLWCASAQLADEIVYECLTAVYSTQGLQEMVTAHKAAGNMSVRNGIAGVSIPLHPGAIRFWKEQGLDIPAQMLP